MESGLLKLQHASFADAISKIDPVPPIFVIGFWRSGTTFLHELLCRNEHWGFPSTYACLNPAHFLLSERWLAKNALSHEATRPMDKMQYSWASPQEDEFALLALGAPSPYEALLAPSLMLDPEPLLDLRLLAREEQQCWIETFRYFLQLITLQQRKRVVLKSPTHGFRLLSLAEFFPSAHYICIERNPYEVYASNINLWRTLLGMYSMEKYSDQQIENFVLASYLVHERAIKEGQNALPKDCFTKVRYEDLVRDPIGQIADIYRCLDLGNFAEVKGQIQDHLCQVSGHVRNPFQLSRFEQEKIETEWGEIITEKGYQCPISEVGVA